MAITLDGTTGITTPGLSLAIENFSTTGNTTLGDASTDTLNVGNGGLVKDANGNVGIGTSSPAQTLHVKTSTAATPITLGVLSNATGLPALSFNGAYASTTMAGIYGNGATASSLYYEVPSGQSHFFGIADVTKMTLDASGNFLVNGTSQSGTANKVAVFSAGKFGLSIIDTTAQATGVGGALNLGGNYRTSGDAQALVRIAAVKENSTDANYAYGMTFSTTPNGGSFTEAGRFTSSGNLGVGNINPTWKLEVDADQESLASFRRITTTTGAGYARFINQGCTFYIGVDSSNGTRISGSGLAYAASMTTEGNTALTFGTNNTNRMTIDTSGNLGIGVTSPNARLDVRGDTGSSVSAIMRIRGTNTTSRTTRLQFEDYAGTLADATIDFKIPTLGSAASAKLQMGINGAAALAIDINGYVTKPYHPAFAAKSLNNIKTTNTWRQNIDKNLGTGFLDL